MNKTKEWIDKIDAHVVRCILRTSVHDLRRYARRIAPVAPDLGKEMRAEAKRIGQLLKDVDRLEKSLPGMPCPFPMLPAHHQTT